MVICFRIVVVLHLVLDIPLFTPNSRKGDALKRDGRGNPRDGIIAELRRLAPDISEGLTAHGMGGAKKQVIHERTFNEKGESISFSRTMFTPHEVDAELIREFNEAGFDVFGLPGTRVEGSAFTPPPDDVHCCQVWQEDACNHGLESCGSLNFMELNFARRTTKKGRQ